MALLGSWVKDPARLFFEDSPRCSWSLTAGTHVRYANIWSALVDTTKQSIGSGALQDIYIARAECELELEEELYWSLINIYRRPEVLFELTKKKDD